MKENFRVDLNYRFTLRILLVTFIVRGDGVTFTCFRFRNDSHESDSRRTPRAYENPGAVARGARHTDDMGCRRSARCARGG